ncbi:MAG: hypothetical protein WCH11_04900 [Bdellovibrio sp.]
MKISRQWISLVSIWAWTSIGLPAWSLSFDWNGSYRFEFTEIDRPTLSGQGQKKSYFLNHLSLSPRIVAMDGVHIVSEIEVLPNSTYPDSQLGAILGSGSKPNASTSSTLSSNQNSTQIGVSQLYLRFQNEYGSLLAGRAPMEFGLGITQNAGRGAFDHWNSSRDLVAYKFMIGNFSFMPILGKVYDPGFTKGGDVTDFIWNVQYENPETESAIGFFWQQRTSNDSSNDSNLSLGGTSSFGYSVASTNLYISRGFELVKIRFEAGFNSGGAGLITSRGEDVKVTGYGMVLDLDFSSQSKWHWNFRSGLLSGDNPDTANFEGFALNRNYDLAFLLFNHPMGDHNALNSSAYRTRSSCSSPPCSTLAIHQMADEEVATNALFLAPRLDYLWSESWTLSNSLIWAQTQVRSATDADRNLGLEWDLGLHYRHTKNLDWIQQLGVFLPGAAWKGSPSAPVEAQTNIGLRSALSLRF